MKKSILSLAVVAGLVAAVPAQAEMKVKWFGYAQITAQQKGDQSNKDGALGGATFGADRVRLGFKLKDGPIFGKLQLDANKTGSKTDQNLPPFIKDAVAGYKINNAFKISAGQFKTPLGMDFNTSGKKLDITKRGMEKKLVLERAVGTMISGRKIANGFGYDVFVGNLAGRGNASPTHNGAAAGNGNSYVGRVMYNMGRMMHVEAAYGVDQGDGSATVTKNNITTSYPNQKSYNVYDVAMRVHMGSNEIKAEYINGSNVQGVANNNENVWYIHYGYTLNKRAELVARYYRASQSYQTATKTGLAKSANLSNLYLGTNLFLGSNKTNGRLQFDYVIASGDDAGSSTSAQYNGVAKGYMDNTFLAQYQISF